MKKIKDDFGDRGKKHPFKNDYNIIKKITFAFLMFTILYINTISYANIDDNEIIDVDEIKKETVSWFSDKGNSEQVEFSNKLASVYDAYQKLLGPDAKELLEQAGCDDAAYPWSDAPVETIEAIVEVVQLPDEP